MPNKKIWVTFSKPGIHAYPGVLEDPNLKGQSYLAYPHRHLFKFKVWIEVFHEDREIEFLNFQEWLLSLYDDSVLELNSKSCEMMSDDLYTQIVERYPGRHITIEVSEDGENGSLADYPVTA